MSNKKTEVQLDSKEEQIETEEINENPASQSEPEGDEGHHIEQGAE